MLAPEIFEFTDYKLYVRARIEAEGERSWGAIRRLAEAAGCQRSYLSQVLRGSAQLTPDQAYGLARHWGLDELGSEYFLALVERDRAASRAFREHLEARLSALRRRGASLSQRVRHAEAPPTAEHELYYATWRPIAVHLATSVPALQRPRAIAEHLRLPLPEVERTLAALAAMGRVSREGASWRHAGGSLHLAQTSPLLPTHLTHWRLRAAESAGAGTDDKVHYTTLHSLSARAFARLRSLLRDFVESSHAVAGPSDPELVACVNLDLFPVGG